MILTSLYSTVYCQNNVRLRVSAGTATSCNCYPPLQKVADATAQPAAVPASWAMYNNGQFYAGIPVTLVEQYIREHGGEKPVRAAMPVAAEA